MAQRVSKGPDKRANTGGRQGSPRIVKEYRIKQAKYLNADCQHSSCLFAGIVLLAMHNCNCQSASSMQAYLAPSKLIDDVTNTGPLSVANGAKSETCPHSLIIVISDVIRQHVDRVYRRSTCRPTFVGPCVAVLRRRETRSSAGAYGPREALCQAISCQLQHNCRNKLYNKATRDRIKGVS